MYSPVIYIFPDGGIGMTKPRITTATDWWDEKTVMLTIRVPEGLRDRFLELCRNEDTTAAREVRSFLKKFVNERQQGELFQKKRGKQK
jgi:hypothetical protein